MASDLLVRASIDMSGANQALQDGAKSVNKYEQQIESAAASTGRFEKTIAQQMREAKNLLVSLERSGKANTKAYQDAQKALADLTDQMGDIQQAARMMASDTVNLDIATRSLNGLVTAMAALQSITALTSTENENLSKIMKGLQAAIAAVTAATVLANMAQKQFIATMKANPYGLVLAGIVGVVAAVASLTSNTKEANSATSKYGETLRSNLAHGYNEIAMLNALINKANDTNRSYQDRIDAVNEINKKYPQLKANLEDETSKVAYLKEEYDKLTTSIINSSRARAKQTKMDELQEQKIALEESLQMQKNLAEYYHEMDAQGGMGAATAYLQQQDIITKTESQIAAIDKEIADIAAEIVDLTGNAGKTIENITGKAGSLFGSDEWLAQQDNDTVKRYWEWVYNGIVNESKNKPIKVKPVIIPPDEEELEDPETTKLIEDYVFKKKVDAMRAENEFNKLDIETKLDYYQEVYQNEANSYEERLEAYRNFLEAKDELAKQEMQAAQSMINSVGYAFTAVGSLLDEQGQKAMQATGTILSSISSMLPKIFSLIAAQEGEAMASGTASAAKLPYPANIAAIASIAAQIMSIIATIGSVVSSSKYATGGIVGGSTTIGDYNLARVNSGEMILNSRQQGHLFSILNGNVGSSAQSAGVVTFKISGSDLVGTLNNYNKIHSRVR